MLSSASAPWWPLTGLVYFLARPGLWWAPLLATAIAWLSIVMVAVGLMWWIWPAATVEGFWAILGGSLVAIVVGLLGALVAWLVVLPLLVFYAFERLVAAVYRRQGVPVHEESLVHGVVSALQVLWRLGIWMLLWFGLAVILALSGVLAPLAPLVVVLGFAHLSVLEACDVALALRGYHGRQRWAAVQQRRSAVFAAALVAAGLSLLLSFTIIGGILVLPAIFTGAALWVGQWSLAGEAIADQQASRQAKI